LKVRYCVLQGKGGARWEAKICTGICSAGAASAHHLPVARYLHPDAFAMFERETEKFGFTHATVGPMVRSSYHADRQARAAGVA